MKYRLEANGSIFEIQKEPLGMWDLWVGYIPTLTFQTPEEAALAVYKQHSGYTIWDQLDEHTAPQDLSGWEIVEEES